jgi:hypothetical protein
MNRCVYNYVMERRSDPRIMRRGDTMKTSIICVAVFMLFMALGPAHAQRCPAGADAFRRVLWPRILSQTRRASVYLVNLWRLRHILQSLAAHDGLGLGLGPVRPE